MADVRASSTYRISIGGDWSLKNLYELPHNFGQVYAFHCAFLLTGVIQVPEGSPDIFASFPWLGGYSAVNFYKHLGSQVPPRFRPKIKSIQYASPGWIDLNLWVPAAVAIGKVVGIFVTSALGLNTLYSAIYKGMQERELMQLDVKRKELELSREQLEFTIDAAQRLAKGLGFDRIDELHERTGHPLATLKMLLSYYRRVRTLAGYVTAGKASFPTSDDGEDDQI